MSVTAAHLRELNALGIVGETLIRVVEIIDEVSALSADKSADVRRGPLESTAEDRRKERDKQRKRLARAAEKAALVSSVLSADASVLSADCPPRATVVLTSLLSSTTGKPLKESKREGMRARGTRLEPGTPLSDEHRALILAEGIHDPDKFWAEFVDYWSEIPGQRGVKVGWTGTLRNRCRDVISKGFNRPSQGSKNGRRTVHEAARDLSRHLAALDEPAPSLCEPASGSPLRLLPPGGRQ